MRISTVILDVDGTLLDTNHLHVDAWREAFAIHGHRVSDEQLNKNIGKGGDLYVPAILGEAIDRTEGDSIRKSHTGLFLGKLKGGAEVAVFPGVVDVLIAMRNRGIKLFVATSSQKEELAATQNAAGLRVESFVDEIITGDDAGTSKPAPDIVAVTVSKAKAQASACVMVGDTPYDGQAAKGAGVAFIGVTCGGCFDETALREAEAEHVFTGLAAMHGHLDDILR